MRKYNKKKLDKAVAIMGLVLFFAFFGLYLFGLLLRPIVDTTGFIREATSYWPIVLVAVVVIMFLFYIIHRFILKSPEPFFAPKSDQPANTRLTCKNGHTVPVWADFDSRSMWGINYGNIESGISVWPEKCPICGAHWRSPGKLQ